MRPIPAIFLALVLTLTGCLALAISGCAASSVKSSLDITKEQAKAFSRTLLLEDQTVHGTCRPLPAGTVVEGTTAPCKSLDQVSWHRHVAILHPDSGKATTWNFCRLDHFTSGSTGSSDCGDNGKMLFWAEKARKMLFQRDGQLYLVSSNGYQRLHLRMPDNLPEGWGMGHYSLSSDAKYIAYTLNTDTAWFYTHHFRKRYKDLMVQRVSGSAPHIVASGYPGYVSAISPNGKLIAYSVGSTVNIATITGHILNAIPVPPEQRRDIDWVKTIRWAPGGNEIAALIKFKLYTAKLNATHFTLVTPGYPVTSVMDFAWSPDSREIAFRSAFEGEKRCQYGLHLTAGVISYRICEPGYRLYVLNVSTGRVNRLPAKTVYTTNVFTPLILFWISGQQELD